MPNYSKLPGMQKINRFYLHWAGAWLFVLIQTSAYTQDKGESQWGSWFMYFGTNTLSERLSIHSEAQFRYYEFADNFNQLLLRTGLNYHINSEAVATLGYAYIGTDASFGELPGDLDSREHRIFEQFILKNTVWQLALEHRYRLEQRFLDLGTRNDTQHRARYRLQVSLPLSPKFFLNFYDEIFLNLQGEVFGQNRAYAALGIRLTPQSSLQLGYLRNHFPSEAFNRFQLAIFINTDLRKNTRKP